MYPIAYMDTSLNVPASSLSPGSITSLTMTAVDSSVI